MTYVTPSIFKWTYLAISRKLRNGTYFANILIPFPCFINHHHMYIDPISQIQSFFIFCSGANNSLLIRTPVEKNKYASIGATIFFTGLFAAIAAEYACYTIFDNVYSPIIMGSFWGLLIFNLDRYIVSTLERKDTPKKNLWAASSRILLALLIAIVITKPLELKIFENEIESELVLIQREKCKTQDKLTQTRYLGRMESLKNDIEL